MAGHSANAVSGRRMNAAASFTFLFALGSTWMVPPTFRVALPISINAVEKNSSQTPLIYASLVALNPARLTMETNHRLMVLCITFSLHLCYKFFFGYFCRKLNISQIMLILLPFDLCYLQHFGPPASWSNSIVRPPPSLLSVFDPQRCVQRSTKTEENASKQSLDMLRNFVLPIAFDFVLKFIFLFNFIRLLSYIFLNLLKLNQT